MIVGRFLARLRAIWRLLRFTPFDSSTPVGRGQERNRRLVLATASAGIARVASIPATLVTLPLVVRYLGPERFGMWVTLTSLIAILTFVDLGLGNGLLNAIAGADAQDDKKAALAYVSGSFFSLLCLASFLGASFALIYPHVPWHELLNVSTPGARAEAGPAVAISVICFLVSMPLGLAQKVYMGYQDSFIASLWTLAGTLLGLLGVVIGVGLEAEFPWLLLAFVGGPVTTVLLSSLHLFAVQRPWLRPRVTAINGTAVRRLMGIGAMFFVLGLAGAIGFQSDNLVIAQILGSREVGQYAVPSKVFFFIPTLIGLGLAPLWPAYREAIIRGETEWVQRTFKRSVKLSILVSGLLTLVIVVFGRDLVQMWTGGTIRPSLGLLVGLGLWSIVCSVSLPIAMLLNGMNAVRFQIIAASTMAVSNILLSIALVDLIGVAGAAYGSVISQFLCVLVPSTRYLRRFFEPDNGHASRQVLQWMGVPAIMDRWNMKSKERVTDG